MAQGYKVLIPPRMLGLSIPFPERIEAEVYVGFDYQLWVMTKAGQRTVASSADAYMFYEEYGIGTPEEKQPLLDKLHGRLVSTTKRPGTN